MKRFLYFLLVVVGAGAIFLTYRHIDRLSSTLQQLEQELADTKKELAAAKEVLGLSDDDRRRLKAVGVWEDDYEGKRTMTLRADGTGTMVVELSGFRAIAVAPKLTFEMVWSIDQAMMTKRTLRGTPSEKVQMILDLMGDTAKEKILDLSETKLRLLDKDNKTTYTWKRVDK